MYIHNRYRVDLVMQSVTLARAKPIFHSIRNFPHSLQPRCEIACNITHTRAHTSFDRRRGRGRGVDDCGIIFELSILYTACVAHDGRLHAHGVPSVINGRTWITMVCQLGDNNIIIVIRPNAVSVCRVGSV